MNFASLDGFSFDEQDTFWSFLLKLQLQGQASGMEK